MAGGFPPHGGRRPGPGGAHGGPPREYVRVTPDGEVQVMFRGNPLVTVRGEGEVVLDTAGHHNGTVLGVLKRALRPMGVLLTAQTENFAEDWSVEDGTNFTRFQDGMVLRPMGRVRRTPIGRSARLRTPSTVP